MGENSEQNACEHVCTSVVAGVDVDVCGAWIGPGLNDLQPSHQTAKCTENNEGCWWVDTSGGDCWSVGWIMLLTRE